jgi:hypothetical protein
MRKSRYAEEQIIGFIQQTDAGLNVAKLCRKEGFSTATFFKWRSKFGGMEAGDAKRCASPRARTPSSRSSWLKLYRTTKR